MTDTAAASEDGRPIGRTEQVLYFAQRPTPEYDEVVLAGDYCLRSYLSFYRFRRTGGANVKKDITSQPMYRGVHYVSDHPPVRLFNLSLIALLVLFESAANAYFFSLNSDFGLLGGLFQAVAVSSANVAVAYFIVGFWGLRHITAPWAYHWPKKFFAIVAIVVGFTLVLTVNLAAAHYRNILDLQVTGLTPPETGSLWDFIPSAREWCAAVTGPANAGNISGAGGSALCRPFNLLSLDSIVLFCLGLAIAALAAFEGRRSDAAFPGLSDAARQLERAREDLRESLETYANSYEDVVKDIKRLLQEDGESKGDFSPEDRVRVYRVLDERVARYRTLLTTPLKQLMEEFGLQSMVDEFSRFKLDGEDLSTNEEKTEKSGAAS